MQGPKKSRSFDEPKSQTCARLPRGWAKSGRERSNRVIWGKISGGGVCACHAVLQRLFFWPEVRLFAQFFAGLGNVLSGCHGPIDSAAVTGK